MSVVLLFLTLCSFFVSMYTSSQEQTSCLLLYSYISIADIICIILIVCLFLCLRILHFSYVKQYWTFFLCILIVLDICVNQVFSVIKIRFTNPLLWNSSLQQPLQRRQNSDNFSLVQCVCNCFWYLLCISTSPFLLRQEIWTYIYNKNRHEIAEMNCLWQTGYWLLDSKEQ